MLFFPSFLSTSSAPVQVDDVRHDVSRAFSFLSLWGDEIINLSLSKMFDDFQSYWYFFGAHTVVRAGRRRLGKMMRIFMQIEVDKVTKIL